MSDGGPTGEDRPPTAEVLANALLAACNGDRRDPFAASHARRSPQGSGSQTQQGPFGGTAKISPKAQWDDLDPGRALLRLSYASMTSWSSALVLSSSVGRTGGVRYPKSPNTPIASNIASSGCSCRAPVTSSNRAAPARLA